MFFECKSSRKLKITQTFVDISHKISKYRPIFSDSDSVSEVLIQTWIVILNYPTISYSFPLEIETWWRIWSRKLNKQMVIILNFFCVLRPEGWNETWFATIEIWHFMQGNSWMRITIILSILSSFLLTNKQTFSNLGGGNGNETVSFYVRFWYLGNTILCAVCGFFSF